MTDPKLDLSRADSELVLTTEQHTHIGAGGGDERDPDLETVTGSFNICSACLDGHGGECHTPGCLLWINRAPDLAIREMLQLHGCTVSRIRAEATAGNSKCRVCGGDFSTAPHGCDCDYPPLRTRAEVDAEIGELMREAYAQTPGLMPMLENEKCCRLMNLCKEPTLPRAELTGEDRAVLEAMAAIKATTVDAAPDLTLDSVYSAMMKLARDAGFTAMLKLEDPRLCAHRCVAVSNRCKKCGTVVTAEEKARVAKETP